MKGLVLLIALCFSFVQFVDAQNKKIFVSKHGGTKHFWNFGKITYNNYYYTNSSDKCDSLICSGSGYEKCRIDSKLFIVEPTYGTKDVALTGEPLIDATYLIAFNDAIQATDKYVRKFKKNEGEFTMSADNKSIIVKYKNADSKGGADILIEVL